MCFPICPGYDWRATTTNGALRTNGVEERFITGDASDWEKFGKWAETVPYTMRNPLYHWTHLELKTAFGVTDLLNPATARDIYDRCSEMLQRPDMSARALMLHYNVEVVCTTDDPVDSLEYHIRTREDGFKVKMLPTWRPDMAMAVENPGKYRDYIKRLGEVAKLNIRSFADLIQALRIRHDFFASVGCRLSGHGLGAFYAEDYTDAEVEAIFNKIYLRNEELTPKEIAVFKTAMLYVFGVIDHDAGWTQQYHYGALRNNNTRMMLAIGPDTGFDSIGDYTVGETMSKFLDMLARDNKLPKTIIYNLNPRDNELVATMIGNFQAGQHILRGRRYVPQQHHRHHHRYRRNGRRTGVFSDQLLFRHPVRLRRGNEHAASRLPGQARRLLHRVLHLRRRLPRRLVPHEAPRPPIQTHRTVNFHPHFLFWN